MGQFFNAPDEQPPLVADTEHRIFQIFNHFIWHTFPWTMPQGFRSSPLVNLFLVTCRNVRYVNIDYNIRRINVRFYGTISASSILVRYPLFYNFLELIYFQLNLVKEIKQKEIELADLWSANSPFINTIKTASSRTY